VGVKDTGLALVYLPADSEAPDANLTLELYDAQCTLIGGRTLDPLPAGSRLARFVAELFEEAGVKAQAREMLGMLVVRSDPSPGRRHLSLGRLSLGRLAAVTLRRSDDSQKEFPRKSRLNEVSGDCLGAVASWLAICSNILTT
jgi:hypothetical protein